MKTQLNDDFDFNQLENEPILKELLPNKKSKLGILPSLIRNKKLIISSIIAIIIFALIGIYNSIYYLITLIAN